MLKLGKKSENVATIGFVAGMIVPMGTIPTMVN
jgi:hypothetical protein